MNLKYNKAIAEADWIASSQTLLAMTPPRHIPPSDHPQELEPVAQEDD